MHSTPRPYSKLPRCLSIQACRQRLVQRLQQAGCDCAEQEANYILQHVTRLSATEFFCQLQRPIAAVEQAEAETILSRRLSHEPLQYILSEAHFYARAYYVDRRVLIPRPESELLVETVCALYRELPFIDGSIWLADAGTGSGCIAVTLACELPAVRVIAADASRPALEVARTNVLRHNANDRVHLVLTDMVRPFSRRLSAIIANLPYISTSELTTLSAEVSAFEPRVALDGGPDGLSAIRRLCRMAPGVLQRHGLLALEVGAGQADDVAGALSDQDVWDNIGTSADLCGISRVVTARLRTPGRGNGAGARL